MALALAGVTREVMRARGARWLAREPEAVRAELEVIAREVATLEAEAARGVDLERLGALVRRVAAWHPEHGLPLIGALGALVRAVRATGAT